ncbi:MAG: lipocalin family protein [Bacteroides sp.]|nr:lipocalin family protein [Bacteroides sp.]
MKTLRLLSTFFILAFLCVGLISCSSDDDNDISIVGTWTIANIEQSMSITFNSDGSFSTAIYFDELDEPATQSGTYQYANGQITFYYSDDSDTVVVTVVSLTSTTMVITGDQEEQTGTATLTRVQ